jgi:hypothetical protein
MRGTTHLDHAGGRRRGGGRREGEGARVLRAAFRQHSGGWRSHRSRSCEAVEQDQQEAAAAPAVVSRRRARRLGPSAALVEGARRISFWGFLAPRLGVRVFADRAHYCAQPGISPSSVASDPSTRLDQHDPNTQLDDPRSRRPPPLGLPTVAPGSPARRTPHATRQCGTAGQRSVGLA